MNKKTLTISAVAMFVSRFMVSYGNPFNEKSNNQTEVAKQNDYIQDELHKWLLPYIDLVKKLSEAKDETEASEQFKNIQTSFTTFNQYFQ